MGSCLSWCLGNGEGDVDGSASSRGGAHSWGSGNRLGGGGAGGTAEGEYGSGAGSAAERRAATQTQGLSSKRSAELAERRQKDDLIGKIVHYYRQAGQKEPFGLPAASVEGLKKHLAHAKSLAKKQ